MAARFLFHTMETCFGGFSTQWKRVSENFPHNGSRFRGFFHTMERCFGRVFHGVEKAGRAGWGVVRADWGASAATAAGAAALAAAYEPWGWTPGGWIGPALLLWAAARGCRRVALWRAWMGLAAFWAVSLFWLTGVSWAGWVALSGYCALWGVPAAWWVNRRKGKSGLGTAAGAAVFWVAGESLRGWVGGGFPWNPLGVAVGGSLPVMQWAAVGGTALPGFAAAFTAGLAAHWGTDWRRSARRWREWAVVAAAAAGLWGGVEWGRRALAAEDARWAAWEAGEGGAERIRLALVQPSIPQPDKWSKEKIEFIYGRLEELTEKARAAGAELVIWPEAALPDEVLWSERSAAFTVGLCGPHELVTGSLDVVGEEGDGYGYVNAAMHFGARGRLLGEYWKRHLVIVGETMPVFRRLPIRAQEWLNLRLGIPLSLTAGREGKRFRPAGREMSFSPLICFEDVVPGLARADARGGAWWLVNLTNDAWFDEVRAPRQHMRNGAFRAVENRVPLVRVANTGVTCIVAPSGRVAAEGASEDGTEWGPGVLVADLRVGRREGTTVWTRWGDWLGGGVCPGIGAALAAAAWWRRRKRRRGGEAEAVRA